MANGLQKVFDKELDRRAAPLIYQYKTRAVNPHDEPYENRVRDCIEALQHTAEAINSAAALLSRCSLTRKHTSEIDSVFSSTNQLDYGLDQFREQLRVHGYTCADLARHIESCTGLSPKRKRGRSRIIHFSAVQSLMRLYEEVTGKSAVFAKDSSAKGGAIQHSTDFVFRCLKKIDQRATLSQAITCINSVRQAEKEENRLNNLIDDAFNKAMAARQLKP